MYVPAVSRRHGTTLTKPKRLMQDDIYSKMWGLQHVRVRGPYACFTRPEFRTERFSSVIPSHSAWEGMFSQIMGKKGSRYHIRRVAMLFHPRWFPCTSQEILSFGKTEGPVNANAQRTLRTTSLLGGRSRRIAPMVPYQDIGRSEGTPRRGTLLRRPGLEESTGVDYIVSFQLETRFSLKELKKEGKDPYTEATKRFEMLQRRLENGHYRGQPSLGLRELKATIHPVWDLNDIVYPEMDLVDHPELGLKAAPYSAYLGLHFFGTDWDAEGKPNYFYPLSINDGIIEYPTWDEVRQYNTESA